MGRNVVFYIPNGFYHSTDVTEIREMIVDWFIEAPGRAFTVSDSTSHPSCVLSFLVLYE